MFVRVSGIGQWGYSGVTSSTQQSALHFHLLLVIVIVIVISLLVGVLTELGFPINVVQLEDRHVLGPIEVNQAMCPFHFILPWLEGTARWNFQESTALLENLWGWTMSGLMREVGTIEYKGLSSARSRVCSIRATASSYSWLYIFLVCSSVGGFPLAGKLTINHPLWYMLL